MTQGLLHAGARGDHSGASVEQNLQRFLRTRCRLPSVQFRMFLGQIAGNQPCIGRVGLGARANAAGVMAKVARVQDVDAYTARVRQFDNQLMVGIGRLDRQQASGRKGVQEPVQFSFLIGYALHMGSPVNRET